MASAADLEGVGLFAGLSASEQETIATLCARRTIAKGDVLIAEGGAEHDLFVVLSGAIMISKKAPEGRDRELATLEGEAVVGDVGMILDSPRTATVTAKTTVEVLVLDAPRYRELLDAGELAAYKVAHNLLVVMAKRQLRSNARLIALLGTERETKLGLDAVKLEQVLGEWGC